MTHISSLTQPCSLCQRPTSPEPHPVLGAPVCAQCLCQRGYEDVNYHSAGVTDGLPMFSVEFEICSCRSHRGADQALVLLNHGFLRTYDPTVSDEYKSPRYQSLAPFQEALPTMESLKDLVDRCCGTHIHIDCPIKLAVQRYSSTLFSPLIWYFIEHEAEAERFWGRNRSDVINTGTRHDTIEFRAPRFRSAQQYLMVVQFCRTVGHCLNQHLDELHPSYAPLPPSQIGDEIVAFYRQLPQVVSVEGSVAHV